MDPLLDPLRDRVVISFAPPPHRHLSSALLFPCSMIPDWEVLRDHLNSEGRILKEDFLSIVSQATTLFSKEPNILQLDDPIVIVGDIHGQFYDLLKGLAMGGDPAYTKYLFLGDYVDRGSFSIETLALLYALKINFPSTIYLLRGNHECRQLTSFFNFRTECLYKYDLEAYDRVMESFDTLPLACILNERFFCIHGGLSPELRTLDDINRIHRFGEPPRSGLFCDLLWSDPVEDPEGRMLESYQYNTARGCAYFFGYDAANRFLGRNDLVAVIRAHEAQLEGYKMHRWGKDSNFPMVITVFSAPNYCDSYNNRAAIIKFSSNTLNVQQFNYVPHPYLLPDFIDIFTWNMPFVIEKTMEVLYYVLKKQPRDIEIDSDVDLMETFHSDAQKAQRQKVLKNKIKLMSKMIGMFKKTRQQSENMLRSPKGSPDKNLMEELMKCKHSPLDTTRAEFMKVREVDKRNEKRPDN